MINIIYTRRIYKRVVTEEFKECLSEKYLHVYNVYV